MRFSVLKASKSDLSHPTTFLLGLFFGAAKILSLRKEQR